MKNTIAFKKQTNQIFGNPLYMVCFVAVVDGTIMTIGASAIYGEKADILASRINALDSIPTLKEIQHATRWAGITYSHMGDNFTRCIHIFS